MSSRRSWPAHSPSENRCRESDTSATVIRRARESRSTRVIEIGQPADFDGAFRAARDGHAQAVQVLPSPWFNVHRRLLITLAARYRLPAMYEFRDYVRDGGLMSYGVSVPDMFRLSARYVDQILKGAKPGDLPIERSAKFDLVINLTAAKSLGLSVPQALLGRADEVIQ